MEIPFPLEYRTDEQVRSGIALAYSNFSNPRGLEKMWNAPWIATIGGLMAPYRGSFTVHCEFPMFIPSLVLKDLNLRRRFEENGLDYYSLEDGYDSSHSEHSDDGDASLNIFSTMSDVDESRSRKSARISEISLKAAKQEEMERKEAVKALWKERAQLRHDQLDEKEDTEDSCAEGYSYGSAATVPSSGAKNEQPDFVVNHVATVDLELPNSPAGWNHYNHRAGKKVRHFCTALIGELKPAPGRALKEKNHAVEIGMGLKAAQRDLCEYCAAHFEIYSRSESVIALAAAGPFWRWGAIRAEDVPKWNWILNEAVDPRSSRATTWNKKFTKDCFILGTEASDRELIKISQKHFHKMLTNGHTT